MTFTPTPEQLDIVAAAKSTSDNLLISALAGAAKTSTLELVAKACIVPTLSLAFNKKIQLEMEKRLPGHVSSKTLNGIGHGVWRTAIGRNLVLDTNKIADLLKARIETLAGRDKTEAWEDFGETLKIIRMARVNGYVPEGQFTHAKRLIDADAFYGSLDDEPSRMQIDFVEEVLTRSIKASYDGQIDFDDQIYMPTLFGGTWPRFPLVMVDEAQDLSPLNHVMLEHLAKKRLIAVGDPNQSIYGFRGAVSNGMEALKRNFDMVEFPLSVSFRCPVAVVELARSRAPHMQYPEWAKPGDVAYAEAWKPADVPDGAAIICRNNAPLFRAALAFIRRGRGVRLVGTDIGPQLIRALKKLGDESMKRFDVHTEINRWEAEKLRKSRAKRSVEDKANCLRVFADQGETLRDAIVYAEHLFKSNGPVQFMTGHKAKGLEFETVYFLDQHLVGMFAEEGEALEQEHNLRYVIQTRAKEMLVHVESEFLQA